MDKRDDEKSEGKRRKGIKKERENGLGSQFRKMDWAVCHLQSGQLPRRGHGHRHAALAEAAGAAHPMEVRGAVARHIQIHH